MSDSDGFEKSLVELFSPVTAQKVEDEDDVLALKAMARILASKKGKNDNSYLNSSDFSIVLNSEVKESEQVRGIGISRDKNTNNIVIGIDDTNSNESGELIRERIFSFVFSHIDQIKSNGLTPFYDRTTKDGRKKLAKMQREFEEEQNP